MKEYTRIVFELDEFLEQLVMTPGNQLTATKKAIKRTRLALVELRRLVIQRGFPDLKCEVQFFKEIKPAVQGRLFYYQAVFEIESLRFRSSPKRFKKSMQAKLNEIQQYMQQEVTHVQYYNCGFTHLDELYFIRGKEEIPVELRGNDYLMDEQFNTWRDQTFAKIRAGEMLMDYLTSEIRKLGLPETDTLEYKFKKRKWTGSKTDLVEIIYALDAAKVVDNGRASIIDLARMFSLIFDVDLTKNLYSLFSEIKDRKKEQTAFLNLLKSFLQQQIDENLEK